jgi:hypothetical protein
MEPVTEGAQLWTSRSALWLSVATCQSTREAYIWGIWDFTRQHQACVGHRPTSLVRNHSKFRDKAEAEQAVKQVFGLLWVADTQPFYEISWKNYDTEFLSYPIGDFSRMYLVLVGRNNILWIRSCVHRTNIHSSETKYTVFLTLNG